MVIKRSSFLTILFVLSILLATLTFALSTVLAEDDASIESVCYLQYSDVISYWCGPDNKYYEGTYDVYWCENGSYDWRLKHYRIVSDFCPF